VTVEERFQKIEELLRATQVRSDLNAQQIAALSQHCCFRQPLSAATQRLRLTLKRAPKHDEALDRIERDIQILIDMRRPKNGKTEGNA
jgi:hypothetical protein